MENEHELSYETLTRVYLGSYEHYKGVVAEVEHSKPGFELQGAKMVETRQNRDFRLRTPRITTPGLCFLRRKWGMKENEEFRSLFILEMILEAKVSFVTRRGHVGVLEDDEERLLDELYELETSFDVLVTPCDAAAKCAFCTQRSSMVSYWEDKSNSSCLLFADGGNIITVVIVVVILVVVIFAIVEVVIIVVVFGVVVVVVDGVPVRFTSTCPWQQSCFQAASKISSQLPLKELLPDGTGNNPVKPNIVKNIQEEKASSYRKVERLGE
ncbi:hypothetical protein Tco_0567236 [Tanacetum coccineum]